MALAGFIATKSSSKAKRSHWGGRLLDGAVFQAYRELIEELANDAAEGPFDNRGRLLVTSEALTRITRSA